MSHDSVSEGLHRASQTLRGRWISESTARASKRIASVQDKDGLIATEQSRSTPGIVREARTAKPYEDPPLYGIPYVHYGI
jgi:hypothetical protein